MSAELFATTVALATTPPEASVTTPVIFPVVETCADEMVGKTTMASVTKRIARLRTLRVYENRAADTTPPPIGHNVLRGLPSPNGRAGLEAPRWRDCILYAATATSLLSAPFGLSQWHWFRVKEPPIHLASVGEKFFSATRAAFLAKSYVALRFPPKK